MIVIKAVSNKLYASITKAIRLQGDCLFIRILPALIEKRKDL